MKTLHLAAVLSLTTVLAMAAPTAPTNSAHLAATVKPVKAEFRTDELLRFLVTFTNQGKEDVQLPIANYLGSQSAGKFTPAIRNTVTGQAWQFRFPSSSAPMQLSQKTLGPGTSVELVYSLPGIFVKADGTSVPHLAPSKYELALTIEVDGLTLTPPAAAFTVVAAPEPQPLTKSDTDKLIAQAREALAKKLARQAEGEKKSSHPSDIPYATLSADKFAATVQQHGKTTTVQFTADLDGDRVLTWSVSLSENGVDPNFGMHGFAIRSKNPDPVRTVAPRPLAP